MIKPWSFHNFRMDMNLDDRFTAADVMLWLKVLFFIPGDTVLYFFITAFPPMAKSLDLGPYSFQGTFSLVVSLIIWFFIGIFLVGGFAVKKTGHSG